MMNTMKNSPSIATQLIGARVKLTNPPLPLKNGYGTLKMIAPQSIRSRQTTNVGGSLMPLYSLPYSPDMPFSEASEEIVTELAKLCVVMENDPTKYAPCDVTIKGLPIWAQVIG